MMKPKMQKKRISTNSKNKKRILKLSNPLKIFLLITLITTKKNLSKMRKGSKKPNYLKRIFSPPLLLQKNKMNKSIKNIKMIILIFLSTFKPRLPNKNSITMNPQNKHNPNPNPPPQSKISLMISLFPDISPPDKKQS